MISARFVIPGLTLLLAIFGCSGGGGPAGEPLPTGGSTAPPLPETQGIHGRYVGYISVGQEREFADALFTRDGMVRIHIGGHYNGAIPANWEWSAQFVGEVSNSDSVTRGTGRLVGQGCALPIPNRFCDQSINAGLSFRSAKPAYGERLLGSITVASESGTETWEFVLDPWSAYYESPISRGSLEGLYSERTAEFAQGSETILDVDATGRVFFQSPASGCVGNGQMKPRPAFGVADVEMTLENCGDPFMYLNGSYRGYSTFSQSDYWGYDAVLRTWLAKADDSTDSAAMTMWSVPR